VQDEQQSSAKAAGTNTKINNNKRRPSNVIDEYPERQIYRSLSPPLLPGNTSYRDVVKHGIKDKICILGTSMVKGINMKFINNQLNNAFAKLRPFPGATIRQLHHYVLPTLTDDTPDTLILHAGCNDINDRNMLSETIASNIISLAKICRQNGVNEVVISSLIVRRNYHLNKKVKEVNKLLFEKCKGEGMCFINNDKIDLSNLWKDGLHLVESGKDILSSNFLDFLTSSY